MSNNVDLQAGVSEVSVPHVKSNDAVHDGKETINDEATPKALPSMPAMLKFGLPLLLLVIVGGGLMASWYLSADGEAGAGAASMPYPLDGATSDSGRTVDGDVTPTSTGAMTTMPDASLDQLSQLNDRILDIESVVEPLRESMSGISAGLTDAQTRLGAMESVASELSGQITRLDSQLSSLSGAVSSLQSGTDGYRKDLARLTKRVDQHARTLKARAQRAAGRPPFRLVSVDEWGGEYSAVLEMAGSSTVASEGDQRAGWTVTRIDRSGCIFVARDGSPSSQPVRICREREGS